MRRVDRARIALCSIHSFRCEPPAARLATLASRDGLSRRIAPTLPDENAGSTMEQACYTILCNRQFPSTSKDTIASVDSLPVRRSAGADLGVLRVAPQPALATRGTQPPDPWQSRHSNFPTTQFLIVRDLTGPTFLLPYLPLHFRQFG